MLHLSVQKGHHWDLHKNEASETFYNKSFTVIFIQILIATPSRRIM